MHAPCPSCFQQHSLAVGAGSPVPLCHHMVPLCSGSCTCGSLWSDEDLVARGWLQCEGTLYGLSAAKKVQMYYRRCANRYDGMEDSIYLQLQQPHAAHLRRVLGLLGCNAAEQAAVLCTPPPAVLTLPARGLCSAPDVTLAAQVCCSFRCQSDCCASWLAHHLSVYWHHPHVRMTVASVTRRYNTSTSTSTTTARQVIGV
jgi:hypothetical protein